MTDYHLYHGKHANPEDGRCAMEWVAYLAGEEHTDHPKCVSPVLREYCIALNDASPFTERQRLRPYLARTIGTVDDGLDDERAWLATDWLFRTWLPTWLDSSRDMLAQRRAVMLRALPPISRDNPAFPAPGRGTSAVANIVETGSAVVARSGAAAMAAATLPVTSRYSELHAIGREALLAVRPLPRRYRGCDDLLQAQRWLLRSQVELLDRMLPTVPVRLPVAPDAELVCQP